LPDATCAKIKYHAEETGRYAMLCAERLRILRLFEVNDIAAPWRLHTIRRRDNATISGDAAGRFGWRRCSQRRQSCRESSKEYHAQ
jgi:hypothetical protein